MKSQLGALIQTKMRQKNYCEAELSYILDELSIYPLAIEVLIWCQHNQSNLMGKMCVSSLAGQSSSDGVTTKVHCGIDVLLHRLALHLFLLEWLKSESE